MKGPYERVLLAMRPLGTGQLIDIGALLPWKYCLSRLCVCCSLVRWATFCGLAKTTHAQRRALGITTPSSLHHDIV